MKLLGSVTGRIRMSPLESSPCEWPGTEVLNSNDQRKKLEALRTTHSFVGVNGFFVMTFGSCIRRSKDF